MTRFISLIAFLVSAFLTSQVMAQTPALKPAVSVSSEIVAIGDLITNAGTKFEYAIFRAPDLGETGKVSAEDILKAAAAHGLTGIDTGGITHVVVTRASRAVTAVEMEEPIAAALAASAGLENPQSVAVGFDSGFTDLQLPVEADGALQIQNAVWQKDSSTFDAVLVVTRIDGREERRAIRGHAVETAPVVVVKNTVQRGAQLSPGDLAIERKPKSQVRDEALIAIADAAGKEAKRTLREGQALYAADLVEPTLVKNGSSVTMILKSGGLTLTASAQALRDGRINETIQVMNVQSKRTLQAVVTGPNEVTVNSPRALMSAAK